MNIKEKNYNKFCLIHDESERKEIYSMSTGIEFGHEGEIRAAKYLERQGYEILDTNYCCKFGELDIVALDTGTLCFVEVKSRRNLRYGAPCEAVTRRKLRHIWRCAYHYMEYLKRDRSNIIYSDIRIEIVELLFKAYGIYLRHIKNGIEIK